MSELPAVRRVTAEHVRAYRDEPGPCEGPELTVCSLVRGALFSWLVCSALLLLLPSLGGGAEGLSSPDLLGVSVLVLGVALLVVAFVGLPLGALVAHLMRAEPRQWRHLVAFAAAGAVGGSLVTLAFFQAPWSPLVPVAAVAATAGRAVLWRRFVPRARTGGSAARGAGGAP